MAATRSSNKQVVLGHATTRQALASIREQGLLVEKADAAAKIRAIWLHAPSLTGWAIVHTQRKHRAHLDDVVVIEVQVSRKALRRFKAGLWFCGGDIPATAITRVWDGEAFGQSVSE